eukprot:1685760-Pyramimonas_sp.AAC.1
MTAAREARTVLWSYGLTGLMCVCVRDCIWRCVRRQRTARRARSYGPMSALRKMMADREASAVEARAEAQREKKKAEEAAAHARQWEAQVQAIAEENSPIFPVRRA